MDLSSHRAGASAKKKMQADQSGFKCPHCKKKLDALPKGVAMAGLFGASPIASPAQLLKPSAGAASMNTDLKLRNQTSAPSQPSFGSPEVNSLPKSTKNAQS